MPKTKTQFVTWRCSATGMVSHGTTYTLRDGSATGALLSTGANSNNVASSSLRTTTTPEESSQLPGTCVAVQVSPTGRATCRTCGRLIALGSYRIAKQVWSDRLEKFIFHYYHYQCFPEEIAVNTAASASSSSAASRTAEAVVTTAASPPTRETTNTTVSAASSSADAKPAATAVTTAASIKREPTATTASASAVTPPQQGKGGGDKYETSPNNLAKCTACRGRITKGSVRIGKETYNERLNRVIHSYYHDACFPADLRSQLHLQGGRTPAQELERQEREQAQRYAVLLQRSKLREDLRQLRLIFARRLSCKPFMVWHDTTLDDLVVYMPTNRQALVNVRGIGPKKVKNFGGSMLQVIRQYRSTTSMTTTTAMAAHAASRNVNTRLRGLQGQALAGTATQEDDDEEEEVQESATLSCEEIVNQKFDHAAANGYMISIDDEGIEFESVDNME